MILILAILENSIVKVLLEIYFIPGFTLLLRSKNFSRSWNHNLQPKIKQLHRCICMSIGVMGILKTQVSMLMGIKRDNGASNYLNILVQFKLIIYVRNTHSLSHSYLRFIIIEYFLFSCWLVSIRKYLSSFFLSNINLSKLPTAISVG